jgi:hypothetical protein
MMTRIRPIFATQISNSFIAEVGLKFINDVFGLPSNFFYAVAGAPYFGCGQANPNMTTDDLLNCLNVSVNTIGTGTLVEANLILAKRYNLKLIAYEGGPDTFGPDNLEAKAASQNDTRIGPIITKYLNDWYASGAEMFLWYHGDATTWNTKYGTWGLTYDISIKTAKLNAFDQFINTTVPVLTARNTVPGVVDALAYSGHFQPFNYA